MIIIPDSSQHHIKFPLHPANAGLHLALAGHALDVIAYDGIREASMDHRDTLLIAPGQRADVLVKAGDPRIYALAAVAYDQGYSSPTGPLASIVVEGEPMEMALPATLGAPPLRSIRDEEITNRRRLWLSAVEPEFPPSASYQEFAFLICGQSAIVSVSSDSDS